MEEAIKELESELGKVKSAIGPLLGFIQEIRDIKKDFRISAESSASSFKILSLAIKTEILGDVNNMILLAEDKIKAAEQEIKEKQQENTEKFLNLKRQDEHLEFMIKETQDLIVKQGNFSEILKREIEIARRILEDKAAYNDILRLQKSLTLYTPLEDMAAVKGKIETLAEKSQIDLLKQSLKKQSTKIHECLSKNEADIRFSNIQEKMFEELKTSFVGIEKFDDDTAELSKRIQKTEEENKTLAKKLELLQEGFKRKLSEIFDTLNSKPWEYEIKHLVPRIESAATKEDLQKSKEELFERIGKANKTLAELEKKSIIFESLIERYDEIILDKASKDDVNFLTKQLEKYSLKLSVQEQNEKLFARLANVDSQLDILHYTQDSIKSLLHNVSQKVENIKKENHDVSIISSTLARIHETIEHKADKSDIFIMYDVMGRKEDLQKVTEIEEICRKQLLLTVGVIQSLCRTLMSSGENPSTVQKQRIDVYKNLEGIQKWIKEGNGDAANFLSIGRSNVNLKSEVFDDGILHAGTARTSRRFRYGSIGTSPRYHKDELPALNL